MVSADIVEGLSLTDWSGSVCSICTRKGVNPVERSVGETHVCVLVEECLKGNNDICGIKKVELFCGKINVCKCFNMTYMPVSGPTMEFVISWKTIKNVDSSCILDSWACINFESSESLLRFI